MMFINIIKFKLFAKEFIQKFDNFNNSIVNERKIKTSNEILDAQL